MSTSVRIVLVTPSHPGNIGAAARAMKLMGLSELVLVSPKDFPSAEATVRATSASDILERALVVQSLPEALEGCTRVYAATARGRSLALPVQTARESAQEIVTLESGSCAILFGCESRGLSNAELSYAHEAIRIPTSTEFSSLNLAQAVQIICYECFIATETMDVDALNKVMLEKGDEAASMAQLSGLYDHLEATLIDLEFLKPKQSKTLMLRLKRLYNRTNLSVNELNILRGILSDTDRMIERTK